MKIILIISLSLLSQKCFAQKEIDPTRLQKINHKPGIEINGVRQSVNIQYDTLMKYGMEIVLNDVRFKVVQFDIMYDCHSGSLVDFSDKRYIGNKILPTDPYFRKGIIPGDVIDVHDTVIMSGNTFYVMDYISYMIVK